MLCRDDGNRVYQVYQASAMSRCCVTDMPGEGQLAARMTSLCSIGHSSAAGRPGKEPRVAADHHRVFWVVLNVVLFHTAISARLTVLVAFGDTAIEKVACAFSLDPTGL